jgi:hypothetical protein
MDSTVVRGRVSGGSEFRASRGGSDAMANSMRDSQDIKFLSGDDCQKARSFVTEKTIKNKSTFNANDFRI